MDKALHLALLESPFLREHLSSFVGATGIPLRLLPVQATKIELLRALRHDPFTAIVMRTCAGETGCLNPIINLSAGIRDQPAPTKTKTACGFIYVGVPLRAGALTLGVLLAGPMAERVPTLSDYAGIMRQFATRGAHLPTREARSAYFAVPVVPRSRLKSMITLLSLLGDHLAESAYHWILSERENEPHCVAVAKAFIQEHAMEPLTLEEISHQVSLSPDHFGKLFRKTTHLTIGEYIARLRVEKVKKMLSDASCRVIEAGFACGFQSVAQFNRVFKKCAGLNPSQYRAACRAQNGKHHDGLPVR
jgi:AraC-like DNA-binding protein